MKCLWMYVNPVLLSLATPAKLSGQRQRGSERTTEVWIKIQEFLHCKGPCCSHDSRLSRSRLFAAGAFGKAWPSTRWSCRGAQMWKFRTNVSNLKLLRLANSPSASSLDSDLRNRLTTELSNGFSGIAKHWLGRACRVHTGAAASNFLKTFLSCDMGISVSLNPKQLEESLSSFPLFSLLLERCTQQLQQLCQGPLFRGNGPAWSSWGLIAS